MQRSLEGLWPGQLICKKLREFSWEVPVSAVVKAEHLSVGSKQFYYASLFSWIFIMSLSLYFSLKLLLYLTFPPQLLNYISIHKFYIFLILFYISRKGVERGVGSKQAPVWYLVGGWD